MNRPDDAHLARAAQPLDIHEGGGREMCAIADHQPDFVGASLRQAVNDSSAGGDSSDPTVGVRTCLEGHSLSLRLCGRGFFAFQRVAPYPKNAPNDVL
jgi:hypothetical protein